MNNGVMYVVLHAKTDVPFDDFYTPIFVGNSSENVDSGFLRDNIGDNISHKNQSYCELTAIYWVWKNTQSEYVGFSHYRRFFKGTFNTPNSGNILSKVEADYLMSKYDVVVSKERNYVIENVRNHYKNSHYIQDLDAAKTVLEKFYPDYIEAFEKILDGTKISLYNMMIMKRDVFEKYCEWLFDVLFKLEPMVDISDRSNYQKRVFGFIAERLLNVWLSNDRNLNIKYLEISSKENRPKFMKGLDYLLLRYKLRSKK